jgi:hypothetical protein
MKLLPGEIDKLSARKMIEHVAFDRVDYPCRLARLGYEIEPATCGYVAFAASVQDIGCDGIAAAKTVEKPAVERRFLKRLLNSSYQGCLRKKWSRSEEIYISIASGASDRLWRTPAAGRSNS